MNRRRCLQIGVLSGAAAAAGCSTAPSAVENSNPGPFDLDEKTIGDLQEMMKSGRLSARSIAEKYLARIETIDRQGPRLSSVLEINPAAHSIAVAANLSAVAIGTETDGSIVCPATANGIVGIKPTVGLVSRSGIVPIAHSQDTAGPMARTVTDAAILLGAITGIDPIDPATRE